ncbi:MAG: hypothetical protein M1814_000986 [Vezdaea aestivalis]|nr:MAG: hypothetical protein M1814_000986 [Vezdaea aestivalis]
MIQNAFFASLTYLVYAVFVPGTHYFHRVWSLSLCTFFLKPLLLSSWKLYLLGFLNLLLCLALSPAQVLLYKWSPASSFQSGIEVVYEPPNREKISADIVFVHGLASNPDTAWRRKLSLDAGEAKAQHKSGPEVHTDKERSQQPDVQASDEAYGQSWVQDFLPEENLNSRILVFKHNTAWEIHALSKSLQNHGDDLVQYLETKRTTPEEKSRPLFFIGHSFGGLIIKQAFISFNSLGPGSIDSLKKATSGHVFLATPHQGAAITKLAKLISVFGFWKGSSHRLLDVIDKDSETNKNLHKAFMRTVRKTCGSNNILCVSESVAQYILGFPIFSVVEEESALIDGTISIISERGHRNIQRFWSRDDSEYRRIRVYLSNDKALQDKLIVAQAKESQKLMDEQRVCLKYLEYDGMNTRADSIEVEKNTCAWIFDHSHYQLWLNNNKPSGGSPGSQEANLKGSPKAPISSNILWLRGHPGVGKSTVIKFASEAQMEKGVVATFYFNARGEKDRNTPARLFQSLIHQIGNQVGEVLTKFQEEKRTSSHSSESFLRRFFKEMVLKASSSTPMWIYIDALDELGTGVEYKRSDQSMKEAFDLVDFLRDLTLPGSQLSFLISSRHDPDYPVNPGEQVIKVEEHNSQDIQTYLDRNFRARVKDKSYLNIDLIQRRITKKSQSLFQWVKLVVDKLTPLARKGSGDDEILRELNKIPQGLKELYEHLFDQIEDLEERRYSLCLMQWIYCARWPLTLTEIRYAVAFAVPENSYPSIEEYKKLSSFCDSDDRMIDRLRSSSCGLAEVSGRSVQFIHESVNDYFEERGFRSLALNQTDAKEQASNSDEPLLSIAHYQPLLSCFRMLNTHEALANVFEGSSMNGDFEEWAQFILHYSLENWCYHARRIDNALASSTMRLLSDAAVQNNYHISTEYDYIGGTALHLAAKYDYVDGVRSILERNLLQVDVINGAGLTPLLAASASRSEGTTKQLIEAGAKVDLIDNDGRTALSWAARFGNDATVKQLIEAGARLA